MRRTLWSPFAGAISIALIALSTPAPAGAAILETYQGLAERHLSPAPLVPTTAPPSLAPLARTITSSASRRRSGYGIRLVHYGPAGPDAVIALEGGSFKSLKAARRDGERQGFKARSTRVRGHSGYLLTRHLGPTSRSLLWVEDGRVHSIGSGTPKKVSLKQLRDTAAGLDRLERYYIGSGGDPDNPAEAALVTTARTITGTVGWGANCVAPGGFAGAARAGTAEVVLLPRRGNAFGFDVARYQLRESRWTGSVAGTISPSAITVNLRATGSFDGDSCDSGAVSFSAARR